MDRVLTYRLRNVAGKQWWNIEKAMREAGFEPTYSTGGAWWPVMAVQRLAYLREAYPIVIPCLFHVCGLNIEEHLDRDAEERCVSDKTGVHIPSRLFTAGYGRREARRKGN